MTTRRLAAILAADLVGFSSMIPIRSHHRLLLDGIGASPDEDGGAWDGTRVNPMHCGGA